MLASHQRNGISSGVAVLCDKPCFVLNGFNWQVNLAEIHDSIVFIDEGDEFVRSNDFASAIQKTDNYYVMATLTVLPNIPYIANEVYGIKNVSGNRYQGTKRIFSEYYLLLAKGLNTPLLPDLVIIEDSNAGFEFFHEVFTNISIHCISANGKSNIQHEVESRDPENILVIADGAAFGSEIDKVLPFRQVKNLELFLPESFEWLVLRSGILKNNSIDTMLESPAEHIESSQYFSWERFFTAFLTSETKDSCLK